MREPRSYESEEGASWLAHAVHTGQPLLWTGHGASLALAQSFAEAIEELGSPARSMPASRCREAPVCVVSQSARAPGPPAALLITESPSRPVWTTAPRLVVPVQENQTSEWLPLSFMKNALESFRSALKLPRWFRPTYQLPDSETRLVLLTQQGAGPLRTLVEAARCKLEAFSLDALAADELGHGLHARLWLKPEAHLLIMLTNSADQSSTWDGVRQWCAEAGVPTQELRLGASPGTGALPLEVFDHGLAAIEAACLSGGIDWKQSRLPKAADWLRDACTPPAHRAGNDNGDGQ